MREFDLQLTTYINSFVGHWQLFDLVVFKLNRLTVVKGAVVAGLLFYAWLTPDRRLSGSKFLHSVLGVLVAIVLARSLQLFLPHSFRPIHDPEIDFTLLATQSRGTLAGWSSFPSDHAVLFFAVATAVFIADRRLGIFAYLWAVFFICLPRLYAGLHWPSDLLGGAVIGVLVMWGAFAIPLPAFVSDTFRRWEERCPAIFFVIAFLVAYQIATLFDEARWVFKSVITALQ